MSQESVEKQLVRTAFEIAERRVRSDKANVVGIFLGGFPRQDATLVDVCVDPDDLRDEWEVTEVPVSAFQEVLNERYASRFSAISVEGLTIREASEHMVGRLDRRINQQYWSLDGDVVLEYNPGFDEKTGKNSGALWCLAKGNFYGGQQ